jgi:TonB-linked SusC/RagA family outer membrane protein
MGTVISFAQQNVSGSVSDGTGPLPGVSVIEKGTSNGTVTDFDGNYSLSVSSQEAVLVFSYIGFTSQELLANSDSLNVILEAGSDELDEVVVTGYGTQRKATVTGAVTAIKGESIVKSPAIDLTNSLAGRLPGITVRQGSGEPGYDGSSINIRGVNTLGNSSPLVVIDGIPDRDGGIGRLNPQDIESISVLKDASSAIYGARAANGVILITTKRGESGTPQLEYSFNSGWSAPTEFPEMSSSYEYANIMNELPIYRSIPVNEWGNAWSSIQSTGIYNSPTDGVSSLSANYSPEAVAGYLNGNDPWRYPNTDWYGDTFKDWAPQQRHNLQLSGGTEKVKYFTSLGYIYQDAIYKNSATFYNQYNLRMNLDAEVNDYVKMNVGLMTRREDRNFPTVGAGAIFRMLQRGRPTENAIWPSGEPGPDIENGENPVTVTTGDTGYIKNPKDYIQINGGLNITNPWIEGLELIVNGSIDVNRETSKNWQTPWKLYSWNGVDQSSSGLTANVRSPFTDARLTESSNSVLNSTFTGQLKYDFTLGENHDIGIFAGVTREQFTGSNFFAFRRNYISPAIDQLFAGGTADQNTGGSAYDRTRLGYYGRLQYNFKDTYLVELLFRRDGSYIFPEVGRYGNFPGVLVGWNIGNESWFNVEPVSYLKLRASYGELGNDQVFYNGQLQEYAFLSTFGFGEYPIDNQVVKTLYETVLPNPNFTWEVARNTNIGLDAKVFDRFNVTLEWFNNQRDRILIQQQGSTPASSGISSLLPPTNFGKMNNRGYEFSLTYDGGDFNYSDPNAFRYTIGINGGYAKNNVVFIDEVSGAPDYQLQEGSPLGAYLLYEADGVFFDQNEINSNTIDYSEVTAQLLPGDLRLVDYNGDGKINADDQVRQEKGFTPTFQYGATLDLSYKNFDLSVLFQGSRGGMATLFNGEFGDWGNFYKYQHDNRWSIDNPSRVHPRLASRGDTYYSGGGYGNNTYRYGATDYFRLKNIELGYTLPESLLSNGFISNLRLYASGLNLLTFTDFEMQDPEVAGRGYPLSKVLNVGLRVNF